MGRESASAINILMATVATAAIAMIAIVLVGMHALAGDMTEVQGTLASIDKRLDRIDLKLEVAK